MPDLSSALIHGVYTLTDAARLTGLPRTRVREWFRTRKSRSRPALFASDYEPDTRAVAISFWDLIDVFVAGQLREHGVSMPTVRKVYAKLASDWGISHPFCRHELLSDGKEVFVRGLDKYGEDEIYEALTRQKAFPKLILPFLQRIDYDQMTDMAARWRIADNVVLDPRLCFGQPVVEGAIVPTYLLAEAFDANGRDAELVAAWYGVTAAEVEAAVRFESGMAA